MKKMLTILICFMMLSIGCMGIVKIEDSEQYFQYNEKNNNRVSVIEKFKLERKNTSYKGIVRHVDIAMSGQLIDEKGNGIANYPLSLFVFAIAAGNIPTNIKTDVSGFFSGKIRGEARDGLVYLWFTQAIKEYQDESLKFMYGDIATIIQPIKITYSINDDGNLITTGTFIEVKESEEGDFDSIIEVERVFQSNNNKIILKKQEFYSEKNKILFIEFRKREEQEKRNANKGIK
ncbi:MAG: hypothetical protein LBT79_02440 [Elusimicrobiota bacterium]|jgi:hypothetical protein|nr:hypothetical protein [Elusimicrobiota bacterium]